MMNNDYQKWLKRDIPMSIRHIATFFLLMTILFSTQELSAKNVTVADFGVVGDGPTPNTKALQNAIDACAV